MNYMHFHFRQDTFTLNAYSIASSFLQPQQMCKDHTHCAGYRYAMLFYLPVRVGSTAPSNFHNFFHIKQGIAVSFVVFSASCNLLEMLTVWIFSKIVFFSIMALLISPSLMKFFFVNYGAKLLLFSCKRPYEVVL